MPARRVYRPYTTTRWMISVCRLSCGLCLREGTHPVRILVTVSPLMYREVIALSIHDRRPGSEVLIAPPRPTDRRTEGFAPHVLVHDAEEAGPPRTLAADLVCRMRVRVAGRVDATVEAGGEVSEILDVSLDDLFVALEETEGLLTA